MLAARQTPAALAYLASNHRFKLPQHLVLLDQKLWELATGRIKRLMVLMPPRHGKSELASKYFPAWFIGRFRKRIILCSYEARFAANWGDKAREVLREYGAEVFGARLSGQSSARDWWELVGGGAMMTAGVGGPITGKGADILIIDDPLKNAEDAASATMREKQWEWYTSTAVTRVEPDGGVLLIQTRWNDDDLAGRLLKAQEKGEGDEWEVLSLPAVADEVEDVALDGGLTYHREPGDALWPARFNASQLAAVRKRVGERVWTALYQQKPTPDGGVIWKREWLLQRYTKPPEKLALLALAIDSAWKTGVANDYSVIAAWGATMTDYYLLDLWRDRVELPDLLTAITDMAAKWKPDAILIEDAASGQGAIQILRRQGRWPIVAYPPVGSKESRAAGVTPLGQAGKVWLPAAAEWLMVWLDEHLRFPNAAHDDCVDTSSMGLSWLRDATESHPNIRSFDD